MRFIFMFFMCMFSLQLVAQEQQMAYQYYRSGEYEKAASIYKTLHEKHSYNSSYTNYLINCYQQLEKFTEAKNLINNQLNTEKNKEYLYVDYGYNYQLQHNKIEAENYYQKALNLISETKNSSLGYLVGKAFQNNHLLDYALQAYQTSMEINPKANYYFQIAFIYGEQGEIEKMFDTYLNMTELNEGYISNAKTYIGQFITEDSQNEHNISLRRLLLKRLQNNPKNTWNQLLSWLFMQQKDYNKALIQEKALFKRNPEKLLGITDVGKIAFENKDYETSKNSFNYILENATNSNDKLVAKLYLLQINREQKASNEIIENQFQQLFNEYGKNAESLSILIVYAEFLAFQKNEIPKAIKELKNTLKFPLNEFEKGRVKIKLADILVFSGKYSSALIYYTQVQNSLKNDEIGQQARFKIAQTSYFKGDFDWAQTQLKVLKRSTSQLISNDALDLNLLITDNEVKDSLKIALKTYAKAELLAFQHKNKAAIDTLSNLYNNKNYKEHPIIDEVLFKQAELYKSEKMFENAEANYLKIIELNAEDILVDDAIYYLAELYLNKFNNTEKAKEYYQKIIFDYPSSIHLVEARKKFRKLRGDVLN
ncbi:Tetratricopeptide repeat-containing protein [Lutibacter oricola]|uniref:Tetratricopeptide repeat-containing protein n=1 Tax=Lutibacter oricola TaxID=762486 RepID=A0A1H2RRD4_9FLAO|nr:tetratricopeptide repeat protein [Lutibacter oricola]SDW21858.1 Tetratricopeptide repeat-containing protein [Lutibacter oricola]